MRTRSVLLSLSLLLPLGAWSGTPEQLVLQPGSRLWVEGKSTIRSFSCQANDMKGVVATTDDADPIRLLATGEKVVKAVEISVPSARMDCGNGTMNDHMRKALKADEFANITFRLSTYDLKSSAGAISGNLVGTLTLGGVQKAITIPAEGTIDGDLLHVTGAYELNMTEYGLTPPSLMFGRIKVRDAVLVRFDLTLKS